MKLDLRTLMFYKNVNQIKLAKDTGISPSAISRYYNNNFNNINKSDIDKLCSYFECSVGDLIKLEEVK